MKAAQADSDKINWGGNGLEIFRSTVMSLSAAAADNSPVAIERDLEIKSVKLVVVAAPDADAAIRIGDGAGVATYLTYTVTNGLAAGIYDITSELTEANVDAGVVLDFSTDGGATAAGTAALAIVVGPRDVS